MKELLRRQSSAIGIHLGDGEVSALLDFAALIRKWNRITNLVGSSSAAELVNNHIVDCLAAVPSIDGANVVDVGSGAGLPGIVVAILRPHSRVTLVETRQRKARFLRQVAIELSLRNVSVAAERIENWRPSQPVECIMCRGYSSLQKFFDDTRPLHHAGCRLVAMKGVACEAEIGALALDGGTVSVRSLSVPGWDHRNVVTIVCANQRYRASRAPQR